jgi:hypothetical protein
MYLNKPPVQTAVDSMVCFGSESNSLIVATEAWLSLGSHFSQMPNQHHILISKEPRILLINAVSIASNGGVPQLVYFSLLYFFE